MKNIIKSVVIIVIILSSVIAFSKKNNWQHKVKLTNPGTRSQGKRGILLYKNKSMGYYFHKILTPIGEFAFKWRRVLWGDKGYFKVSKKTSNNIFMSLQTSPTKMKKIIRRGYYEKFSKYKRTPSNWIRVMRNGKYYWLDPERISYLIKKKKINSLLNKYLRLR